MFNDHLNFSNNIYDNLSVRKQIEDYKSLCEQLQEKINILEAGYAKALRSGSKERMEKELARQKYLEKFKEELSDKGIDIGTENFDTLDPEVQRRMNPSDATRMNLVNMRTGNIETGTDGKEYTTGRKGHKQNIKNLAMPLDIEYPLPGGKKRVTLKDLPAESPFPSDLPFGSIMIPHSSNATY